MANYELVIGSKFQPFSYERYIKPYQLYNEAYTKQEEALDTLSVQTETLRQRALTEKQNGNNKWAQRYLDYADSLQRQAEALSREGLNINSRKALSSLKRQYGDTVVPVQKAVEAQAALAKIAASQNPALRMQYGAMPTIDELIADPTKTQIGYSGAAVEESAAKLAAQAASRTTSDSFNAFRHYWMKHLQTVGYNQATINEFLDDARKVPELEKIYKQVTDQFGGFEGLSDAQKNKMKGEILTGILKGAGYKESVNYQQNPIAVEQWKASQAASQYGSGLLKGTLPIDMHHILSPSQEGARGEARIKGLIGILGLSPSLNGRYGINGSKMGNIISVNGTTPGGVQYAGDINSIKTSNKNDAIKWFTDKGNIMRKDLFIAQGKSKEDKVALSKLYDNTVRELKDLVNFSSNKMNVLEISKGLNNVRAGLGSYTMGAFRLPFEDNNKVLTDVLLPLLSQNDKDTAIKEIDSFDRAGNIKSTGKTVNMDTFIDKEGKPKASPMFFAPPTENTKGIIMRFKGKSYLIPIERLGSIAGEAYSNDAPMLNKWNNIKKAIIKEYGEEAYYNSDIGKQIEQILEQSGGGYIRSVVNGIDLQYKANPSVVNTEIK